MYEIALRSIRRITLLVAVPTLIIFLISFDASAQSNIVRLGDATAGPVSQIASCPLGWNRLVTAVRTASGTLEVIQWRIEDNGSVTRLSSGLAGAISKVAISPLGDARVVTAVRTGSGTLKLIAWDTPADGSVSRRSDTEAGEVSDFAIATTGLNRLVTAVRTKSKNLKLISWALSRQGEFQRLHELLAGEVQELALVGYDRMRLITAVRTASGNLKLITWSLNPEGGFVRLGDLTGAAASQIDIVLLSYRRVITAVRDGAGDLELATWDIDASGQIKQRSTAKAGEISAVSVVSLAGAHAITAVRQNSGTLKLIHWDAVGAIERLGDVSAGPVNQISVDILRDYRIVTSVRQNDGSLKVIAWNEHVMTLLRRQWGPTTSALSVSAKNAIEVIAKRTLTEPVESRQPSLLDRVKASGVVAIADIAEPRLPGSITSPMYSLRFEPGVEEANWDPMIAVGHNFIVVTTDHQIGFFDKQGKALPKKNSLETKMGSTTFFIEFLQPNGPDGQPNEHSINRHLAFPSWQYSGMDCDPTVAAPAPTPCINEFYDTRVHFDPESQRFIILSAARHSNLGYSRDMDLSTDPLVRRYVAFAISKTEDPRDGFYQYITTESNYSDWPRVTVSNSMLIVGHNSKQSIKDGTKPVAYLYPMEALRKGTPHPLTHKVFPSETGGRNVMLVTPYGPSSGWNFLMGYSDNKVDLHAFRTPTDWTLPVSLSTTSVTLSGTIGWVKTRAFVRSDRIFFVCDKPITNRVPNGKNGRSSVRVVRIPLTGLNSQPTASTSIANGFLDTFFGKNAASDDPNDLVSYEEPSMAVNKNGDMIIVYGRVGFETKTELFPEARYNVYYADSRGLQPSRLLQAGDHMPMDVKKDETVSTITSPGDRMDHSDAVVDPSDDTTMWAIVEYANTSAGQNTKLVDGYHTVVAKVKP
jgi:hypothetical protein